VDAGLYVINTSRTLITLLGQHRSAPAITRRAIEAGDSPARTLRAISTANEIEYTDATRRG
jgi:hypothetical protein